MRVPGLLLIGATGRKAGKTELACSILRSHALEHKIIGVKVTPVDCNHGQYLATGTDCSVHSPLSDGYLITRETNAAPKKDTGRLLNAGAVSVYWLRCVKPRLKEGFEHLLQLIPEGSLILCESTSLRAVLDPDLFLLAGDPESGSIKASAAAVLDQADWVFKPGTDDYQEGLNRLTVSPSGWGLREKATAIVLAGGRSSRMGANKPMLPVAGKPLIQHVIDQLRPHFDEILVSCDSPSSYQFLGLPIVEDRIRGQGPLGGIGSALAVSSNDYNLVVACDMPALSIHLARKLLRAARGRAGAVPTTGKDKFEPLFAVYHKSVAQDALSLLETGDRRPASIWEGRDFCFVPVDEADVHAFLNLNRQEDYDRFLNARGRP